MVGFDPWTRRTGGGPDQGITVLQPSKYRAFVFVVPEEQVAPFRCYDVHKSFPLRRAPYEGYCEGEQRFEVTTALYLSPTEFDDLPVLLPNLTRGVGLDPEWATAE